MLLSSLFSPSNFIIGVELFFASLFIYALYSAIYNRYFHPYAKYPGPFWASITPLWYYRAVRYGRAQDTQLPIHQKYGNFVRLAPDEVQIMDPAAIDTIYGPKNVFTKSEFYAGFDPHISPRKGNFEEQDEAKHTLRRRIVAPLYTQGSILEFEPCVDRLIALFYRQMETFASTGETFDMAAWLRKYTFDVIGEIFYGREGGFGFIRDDIDYNNWCALMDTMPNPAAAKTYVPWGFQNLFFFSEFFSSKTRFGAKGFYDVINQAHAAVKERLAEREHSYSDTKGKERVDMLTRLLDLVNNSPDKKVHWTILDVTAEIWTMIWAGSDTTAISLTAIFYFLHNHPDTLQTLRDEIDESLNNGTLTYPFRYADCIKLPYLHAVVRESMRIHNSLGTGLPRIVPRPLDPSGGKRTTTILDHEFPPGHGVLMNPNASHFHEPTFGPDALSFKPARWLTVNETYFPHLSAKENADRMERNMLHFGYGPRICIGKHITMTEMYKLLPTILRDFEFEIQKQDPRMRGGKWTVWSGWFQQQKDVWVKVKRRREKVEGEGVVVGIDQRWGKKRTKLS